jgi:hypothetical protein
MQSEAGSSNEAARILPTPAPGPAAAEFGVFLQALELLQGQAGGA